MKEMIFRFQTGVLFLQGSGFLFQMGYLFPEMGILFTQPRHFRSEFLYLFAVTAVLGFHGI